MWDISTKRRLALLFAAVVLSALVSLYRMGPLPHDGYREAAYGAAIDDPAVRRNLAAYLRAHYAHAVEAPDVYVTQTNDAPTGYGQGFVMWYSAWPIDAGQRDIFAARGRLSAAGIPLVMDRPHNVTQTPDGDDRVFDVRGDRLLYGVWVGGKMHEAVVLEFAERTGHDAESLETGVAYRLDAEQTYGTARAPQRTDFFLGEPARWVEGELLAEGFRLAVTPDRSDSKSAYTVDVDIALRRVHPHTTGRLLHRRSETITAREAWGDVLRRSGIIGLRRTLAFERVSRTLDEWLERQQHTIFGESGALTPIARPQSTAKPALEGWPPKPLRFEGKTLMPGEGRWRIPAPFAGVSDPPVRTTFLRVDPAHSYQRTQLFAFDMTRLGLQFASGVEHPRSTTGLRGSGRVAKPHREHVLAAFSGGLKGEMGEFGVVEEGRVLVPPGQGLATVAMDRDGRARMGLWDVESLRPPWTALRQNMAALIVDGTVSPSRTHRWGQTVAATDDLRVARSALGVTDSGYLVYGWSKGTTASLLGEALRRAGVQFAVHLSIDSPQGGIELYRDGVNGGRKAAGSPDMALERGVWTGTVARDFFYLFRSGRLPRAVPRRGKTWDPDEGIYRVVQWSEGIDVMARTYLTPARTGGREQVTLHLIDIARLKPHFLLGVAESRRGAGRSMFSILPEEDLVSWMNVGLRAPFSRHGLMVGGRLLRPPVPGRTTFAVSREDDVFIGRYGEAAVPLDGQWRLLVQGPALVEKGVPTVEAKGRAGLPLVGAGRVGDRFLVLATEPRGDRAALARALILAGADEALLLGERGTSETGRTRLYFDRGAKTLMASDEREALVSPNRRIGAGSAMLFTGRRAPSFAGYAPTFQTLGVQAADRN